MRPVRTKNEQETAHRRKLVVPGCRNRPVVTGGYRVVNVI